MYLVDSILNGNVDVAQEDIIRLAGMVKNIYRSKPNVVEIPSRNLIFVGDLHGELDSILSVQRLFQKYRNHSFIFLGDYADRGPAQVETVNLVMALALSEPDRVTLLRGNHESDEVAQRYGFYTEVTRKFSFELYSEYFEMFQVLPMAAFSPNAIFACHGGIPEGVTSIDDIQQCERTNLNFPDDTLFQLAWNDPKDADFRFAANSRGMRVKSFGRKAFDEFMENLDLKLMIRAHEVFALGVKSFFDGRLMSVFSASYRGAATPKVIRVGGDLAVELISLVD
ncbi:MAG: metallophosphoesterase [Candidatus Thorarchaeota archaeon]